MVEIVSRTAYDVRNLALCTVMTGFWVAGVGSPAARGGTITGRSITSPIYGVTLDDVSDPAAQVNSVSRVVRAPTARIVFDKGVKLSYYLTPIKQLRGGPHN